MTLHVSFQSQTTRKYTKAYNKLIRRLDKADPTQKSNIIKGIKLYVTGGITGIFALLAVQNLDIFSENDQEAKAWEPENHHSQPPARDNYQGPSGEPGPPLEQPSTPSHGFSSITIPHAFEENGKNGELGMPGAWNSEGLKLQIF